MKLPFFGPSHPLPWPMQNCQRTINFLPEPDDSASARSQLIMRRTPGLKLFATVGAGPIRALWAGEYRLFAASGDSLYEVFGDGSCQNRSALPGAVTLGNDGKPARIYANGNQLFIVSAGHAYCDNGSGPQACFIGHLVFGVDTYSGAGISGKLMADVAAGDDTLYFKLTAGTLPTRGRPFWFLIGDEYFECNSWLENSDTASVAGIVMHFKGWSESTLYLLPSSGVVGILTVAYTAGGTSLSFTLSSGALPAGGNTFWLHVGLEKFLVSAWTIASGTYTATVTGGQVGTTASDHSIGDAVSGAGSLPESGTDFFLNIDTEYLLVKDWAVDANTANLSATLLAAYTAGDTSLTFQVNSGTLPGSGLYFWVKVDSEYLLVSDWSLDEGASSVSGSVVSAYTAGGTTLSFTISTGTLPASGTGCWLKVDSEYFLVTAWTLASGTYTATVVGAQGGTSAADHAVWAIVSGIDAVVATVAGAEGGTTAANHSLGATLAGIPVVRADVVGGECYTTAEDHAAGTAYVGYPVTIAQVDGGQAGSSKADHGSGSALSGCNVVKWNSGPTFITINVDDQVVVNYAAAYVVNAVDATTLILATDPGNQSDVAMTHEFLDGTCNVSGTAVTWASGDTFPTDGSFVGTPIDIAGVYYYVASVQSDKALTLMASAGTQAGVRWGASALLTASQGTYMDGYFIVARPNSRQFNISGILDGTSWDSLDYASKEAYPDDIAAILADHEELWIFGDEAGTEVWQDTGAAAFPFQRDQGAFISYSCQAPWSVCRFNNGVAWIGGDQERGGPIAWWAQGFQPVRISDASVEQVWARYPTIADAVSYAAIEDGHHLLFITFPSANVTWVYDATASQAAKIPMWSERGWWNGASLDRQRPGFHAYVALAPVAWSATSTYQVGALVSYQGSYYRSIQKANLNRLPTDTNYWTAIPQAVSQHFAADWQSGKIYIQSVDFLDDDGVPIHRVRVGGHVANENLRVFGARFELLADVMSGTLNPTLDYSTDYGHTFINPQQRTTLQPGISNQHKARLVWRRQGAPRDRVFRLTVSDAADFALIDAFWDGQAGNA